MCGVWFHGDRVDEAGWRDHGGFDLGSLGTVLGSFGLLPVAGNVGESGKGFPKAVVSHLGVFVLHGEGFGGVVCRACGALAVAGWGLLWSGSGW